MFLFASGDWFMIAGVMIFRGEPGVTTQFVGDEVHLKSAAMM